MYLIFLNQNRTYSRDIVGKSANATGPQRFLANETFYKPAKHFQTIYLVSIDFDLPFTELKLLYYKKSYQNKSIGSAGKHLNLVALQSYQWIGQKRCFEMWVCLIMSHDINKKETALGNFQDNLANLF